jgi:primosomal protein N' (replication factor Y) (superfamily II helicase)
MFVNIAVNIPADKVFSYSVPVRLEPQVAVGKRALVPFGRKRLSGYIVDCATELPCNGVKDIVDILDRDPLFGEEDLSFYRWISKYYLYPLGKTIHDLTPGGINIASERWITSRGLSESGYPACRNLSLPERQIMEIVSGEPGGMALDRLKKLLGRASLDQHVKSLSGMGFIEVEERLKRPGVGLKKEKIITLNDASESSARRTEKQSRLIAYLKEAGSATMVSLRREFKDVSSVVAALERKGVVRVTETDVYRSARHLIPEGKGSLIVPNDDQEAALGEIIKGTESNGFSPFLLHGVTGSGKTEVYLRAIARTLDTGGGAIYLVPEISLTPQLISRIGDRFAADRVAVIHSDIPQALRYDQWRRICSGEIRLVVGARSALFAPVQNLKLIIVDEEHDNSYKQEDRLCYHARDLALVKARLLSAAAVLGSATPAVQTFFNAARGKYRYLALPQRVENRPLPDIRIVDMKGEHDEYGEAPVLSRYLKEAIGVTLANKKQTLLFLNRRGFNTYLFCRDCGHVFQCPNCDLALTYYAGQAVLKCHCCDFAEATPSVCPACKCARIGRYGIGTERLAEEAQRCFPSARIERMDSDTMSRRGAYEKIMNALQDGSIDILVGTQMIAKGHDYPGITLVGVVGADMGLNIPDFRAAERTFQVLTQVSGRGGRGDTPGSVVIQTFNPDNYAIRRAQHHHYEGFYSDELPQRQALFYPPFSRMINLQISCLRKDRGKAGAERLGRLARELLEQKNLKGRIDIVGPAEAPIPKIKGRYRWHMLLKGANPWSLKDLARAIMAKAKTSDLDIRADVDPVSFM